jgi:hypothetical protein
MQITRILFLQARLRFGFASSEIVRQPFYLVRDNRHKVMKCQPFTVGRQPQKSEEIPRRYARSG